MRPKRRSQRGHAATDSPKPDYPERFPFELDQESARPLATSHVPVQRWDAPSDREHKSQRVLSDRVRVDPWRVRNHDASLAARGQINVVRSCAPDRDHPH
jgi:hypothetical protein